MMMRLALNKVHKSTTNQSSCRLLLKLCSNKRHNSTKIIASADEAVRQFIKAGSTLLVGGFGLCGIPENLIVALRKQPSISQLRIVSNNAGYVL
jgi:3-oxoacid CoA-transferase